ncbi:MAG: caspase family protein [Ilumatobacteraceae bacterium]
MAGQSVLRRRSLIIATASHDDARLTPLSSPAADAVEVHSLLADPRRGDFDSRLLVDASAAQVRRELERFVVAEVDRRDLILVFYSGHGVKDDDGNLYLTTSDTSLDLLRSTAVPARFVSELMAASRAASQIIVLDCCFSGAFGHGLTPKADAETGIGDALRPPEGGSGRVVLTASSAVQYSFEAMDPAAERARSVYTAALVEGLRSGSADANGDGVISTSEWHQYASRRVMDVTTSQRPRMWSFDVEDEPIVARVSGPARGTGPRPNASLELPPPAPPAPPAPLPDAVPSRRRLRWALAGACAAALLVVAAVVLARGGGDDDESSAADNSSPGLVETSASAAQPSVAPTSDESAGTTTAPSATQPTALEAGAFIRPVGLEVLADSQYHVADCSQSTIFGLSEGQPLWTAYPRLGIEFECPADITAVQIDGTWHTFITDRNKSRLVTIVDSKASVVEPDPVASSRTTFDSPGGAVGSGSRVFVADGDLHCVLEYEVTTNVLTDHLGRCGAAGRGTGGQARLDFLLDSPDGIAIHQGRLIVADSGNNRIVAVDADGVVEIIAGAPDGAEGFAGDGGPAVDSLLNNPYRVASVGDDLFISDYSNQRIRKIGADGLITTVIGGGQEDPFVTSDPLAADVRPVALDQRDGALVFTSIVDHPGVFIVEQGRLRAISPQP